MRYEIEKYKDYELASLPKDSIKELEELSRVCATEGIVMLENKSDTLPLKKGDKVSVFGRIQREYYKSGTGSGGLVNVKYVTNILDSLRECDGIEINEEYCLWAAKRLKMADENAEIQGYSDGVFWERNSQRNHTL